MIKNQRLLKSIAEERVRRLFRLSKSRVLSSGGPDRLSARYLDIAESIIKHYKIAPGHEMKNEVCKACKTVLIPGATCSVRLSSTNGYVVLACRCGEEKHVNYRNTI
jgi:RNase P subunit RPR2